MKRKEAAPAEEASLENGEVPDASRALLARIHTAVGSLLEKRGKNSDALGHEQIMALAVQVLESRGQMSGALGKDTSQMQGIKFKHGTASATARALAHWLNVDANNPSAFLDAVLAQIKKDGGAALRKHLLMDRTFSRDTPVVGRNAPCPYCASGKKFKNCCMTKA